MPEEDAEFQAAFPTTVEPCTGWRRRSKPTAIEREKLAKGSVRTCVDGVPEDLRMVRLGAPLKSLSPVQVFGIDVRATDAFTLSIRIPPKSVLDMPVPSIKARLDRNARASVSVFQCPCCSVIEAKGTPPDWNAGAATWRVTQGPEQVTRIPAEVGCSTVTTPVVLPYT